MNPIANIEIVEDVSFLNYAEFIGFQPSPVGLDPETGEFIMIDSPKYRVRLSETGDTKISFSSANSSDVGTGIAKFTWTVNGDGDLQEIELPASQTDWSYTFRNLTSGSDFIVIELFVNDARGLPNTVPTRIFFEVVGELFGDCLLYTSPSPRD